MVFGSGTGSEGDGMRLMAYLMPLLCGVGFGANAVAMVYRADPVWHGLTALFSLVGGLIFVLLPDAQKSINGQTGGHNGLLEGTNGLTEGPAGASHQSQLTDRLSKQQGEALPADAFLDIPKRE